MNSKTSEVPWPWKEWLTIEALTKEPFSNFPFLRFARYSSFQGLMKLVYIVYAVEKIRIQHEVNRRSFRILDCGCSFGQISLPLASLGYQVLGIDLSREALDIAMYRKSKTGFRNLRFKQADVQSYLVNQPEDTFHIAILGDFLEHLEYPSSLIRLLDQKLVHGGVLIITIPNGFGFGEMFLIKPARIMRAILNKKSPPGRNHVQSFTTWRIRKLLSPEFEVLNFSNIDILPFGRSRLALVDLKLAKRLPLFLGNSWILTAAKTNQ